MTPTFRGDAMLKSLNQVSQDTPDDEESDWIYLDTLGDDDYRPENMLALVILYCSVLALAFLIWVTR